jgi:hypothetical protein
MCIQCHSVGHGYHSEMEARVQSCVDTQGSVATIASASPATKRRNCFIARFEILRVEAKMCSVRQN